MRFLEETITIATEKQATAAWEYTFLSDSEWLMGIKDNDKKTNVTTVPDQQAAANDTTGHGTDWGVASPPGNSVFKMQARPSSLINI